MVKKSQPTLNIITPLADIERIDILAESVARLKPHFDVIWWLVFNGQPQPIAMAVLDALCVNSINSVFLYAPDPAKPKNAHAQRSAALDAITEGWVLMLDDNDNIHPIFGLRIAEHIAAHPDTQGFVVGRRSRDGAITLPTPEHLAPAKVDASQYVMTRKVIGDTKHGEDGAFAQAVYEANPKKFAFIQEALTQEV